MASSTVAAPVCASVCTAMLLMALAWLLFTAAVALIWCRTLPTAGAADVNECAHEAESATAVQDHDRQRRDSRSSDSADGGRRSRALGRHG